MLVHASIVALLVTAVLCALGSFNPRFEDNTLQRVGLAVLGFASSLRMIALTTSTWVDPIEALLYIGAATFALGTFFNSKHFHKATSCSPASKPTVR